MSTVEAAVSEINRVAAWALRGLGMAFGVADRAAPIVGWAEAVEGGALRALRSNTPLLDGPKPIVRHRQISETVWTFDASGRSLLELGPVAVDLLTLAARTGQMGQIDFTNVSDAVFLSGIMRIAGRRGIGCVALSAGAHLTLCGSAVTTLHALPGQSRVIFADRYDGLQGLLRQAVDRGVGQIGSKAARDGALTLLSYAPGEASPLYDEESAFDAEGKFALGQAKGVQVERADLAHLYALEIRTWAPTSDRSRKQAVF